MSGDRELFGQEGKSWETRGEDQTQPPPDTQAEGVATGISDDDDIIELVDVAREGEPRSDFEEEGVSITVDEEAPPEENEDFLARQDEGLEDLSLPLDDTGETEIDTDLMLTDELDDRLDSPDFDFEGPEDLDEPDVKKAVSDISEDDLDLAMADFGDELEVETPEPEKKDETLPPPISQERLEAIVTETVTEVVERVVRETVAEVAERVIKEAIESLRESLDTPPE